MKHYELIIIGHGMAANRLLQQLANQPQRPRSILVIGEEEHGGYNRVLLSSLLANEVETPALQLCSADWYQQQAIDQINLSRVTQIDTAQRRLTCNHGECFSYSKLVLATGSRPTIPDIPGSDLGFVMSFRRLQDVQRMQRFAAVEQPRKAVVLGGGLLGLEAAEGLRKLGVETTVVHKAPWLLNRQLDDTAAQILAQTLTERGLKIITNSQIERICRNPLRPSSGEVWLDSGQMIAADLVVIAIGITPNITLAQEAGLECERAIVVNAQMQSADPHIYALGECCQFESHTYGLVAPIWRQAETLAGVLSDQPDTPLYREEAVATQLKISGISLFSSGELDPADAETLHFHDPETGEYRRLWLRNNRLIGAVLFTHVEYGALYHRLITEQRDISALRDELLFLDEQMLAA